MNLSSNILLKNSILSEMEGISSHSAQDKDECAELQNAINMSLEQPEAETMSDTSLNTEDQAESEKALILSMLSSEELDEAVAELHYNKSSEPISEMESLQKTIKVNELNNAAVHHPSKPGLLNNLGCAYKSRFAHLRELDDIDSAIATLKEAVKLTLDGDAHKCSWLSSLGNAYQSRFGHLGEVSDIESAIVALKEAIKLTPDGNANKLPQLDYLGSAYQLRFHHLGDLSDIESAIVALKQAVELAPDGHASKSSLLNNLGNVYHLQFVHLGELSGINNAIVTLKEAIKLTPDGHANKILQLSNLGTTYHSRFSHLRELGDIESAIVALKQAVELAADDHADKSQLLNNLGKAYHSRFGHLRELSDIESAIVALNQAVKLTPDGHHKKSGWFRDLSEVYRTRFSQLGEVSDIESAIVALKQAMELIPDGHADKYPYLSDLGIAYELRFGHLGELGDIESAIVALKQAFILSPDDHANKSLCLNNLSLVYQTRFRHLGDSDDLKTAIMALKQAIELTPDGHPSKSGLLNNLRDAYWSRVGYLGELSDLESTITALKQAVELTPDGHIKKSSWLNKLGKAYLSRFSRLGEVDDIKSAIPSDIASAIAALKQAVELTPDGFANKSRCLYDLGRAYYSQFGQSQNTIDHDSALSAFQRASLLSSALAVQAYTRFFELIPQVVWLGKKVGHRYEELPHIGRVISAAAATAISAGDLPLALEWLNEGRSIIWGQILQLRSPLDNLNDQHPQIGKELETVIQALQNAETSINIDFVHSGIKEATLEEESQKHHRMAARYEELVQHIRGLDGFTSFLKPKKFSELVSAATHGPVITVNVDEDQCDALILCHSGVIIHVPLPMFSLKQAQQLHLKLISSLHFKGVRIDHNGDRATRLGLASGGKNDHFAMILKALWLNVVHPILSKIEDILHESAADTIPHITWCPTGPLTLLPLHAAGIYGDPTERNINISDFVVSSYTTTLSALINSAPKFKQHQAKIPTVLIVSQPKTPGMSPLPGTAEEAKVIQKYTLSTHTCHLNHDAATADAVMHKMGEYDFIHFACHGIQDIDNPLDSAFALYDQRLRLKALMSLSLDNVQLAVLSACQTATGDENLPEEAVHLAAGMLAVGYPSVIATLWSIGDMEAPLIADKVYANLLGHHDNSGESKSKMTPAYALHEATKNLRKEVGETNFVKWVPFIHLGI
ncbi:TPR-like protein [Gymnopus androsaceus JB14]|uniref:TPR-like protein n=1 Tax=Gymnopus androsaceus JB14 TaxID=1447944 RepID=A0A6A4I409_9AGAR|nr:TPR-like protein [Gymnopus androsaceus JB14]